MPQCQMDAFLAVSHRLPQIGDKLAEIAKQLKISNHLKLLELKKGEIGNSPLLEDIEKELDD